MFRVVVSSQIRENGSAFEDEEVIAVMVDYCWDAAVRVDFGKPGLFLDVFHYVDALVGVVFAVGFLFYGVRYADFGGWQGENVTFSSSRIMETLCPFGVPKVRSSMPDLAIKPVGLSEEDIVRLNGI